MRGGGTSREASQRLSGLGLFLGYPQHTASYDVYSFYCVGNRKEQCWVRKILLKSINIPFLRDLKIAIKVFNILCFYI